MAELKLENIYPTLFIGLGGAGGEVLSRLNRLFERDFGDETRELGASPLQFLLLDTDDFEKLPQEVRRNLGNRERNFLSLSHFNPRRYAEGQLAFKDSDLHRWFDPRALPFVEDAIIHDGASRLRMLGRLCLHHRYHEVEQRIRQKFEEAMDARVHSAAQRIKAEPRPFRCFIVTSSCGGTGSALFVDIACLVNRIVRDRGTTPDVQGFVFLPFPFIEANAQIDPALESFYQHNAWAFFEELNHVLRQPDQLPGVVLDPGRAYGDPPRPFEYGRDLLRTIYLVGHHIPPVGTLDLGEPLYSYVAHGIYHVFLTPEEGRIQSSYSNIKSKLQEPDRSFRYIKRFATFGYAEYRLAPHRYAHRIATMLVERERQALLGIESTDELVAREAKELVHHLERYIETELDGVRAWAPSLPTASGVVGDDAAEEVARAIEGLPLIAARDLERRRDQLDERDIPRGVRDRIEGMLEQRFAELPGGLRLEQRLIEKLTQQLARLADRLTAAPAEAPLEADRAITDRVRRLARDAGDVDRRLLGAGPVRRDRARARELESGVAALCAQITDAARARLIAELERRVGHAIRAVCEGEWIRALSERIARSIAAFDRPIAWTDEDAVKESPTIQQIPPDAMLAEIDLPARAARLQREHADSAGTRRRALWEILQTRLGRHPDALDDFYRELYREWLRHAVQEAPAPEALLRAWDEWRAQVRDAREAAALAADGDALKRLMPLATPACPLDVDRLHKQDTAALITVGVGSFKHVDDARTQLGAAGPFELIDNGGNRFAVLKTLYAFSSRAIEGMETLRRSYQDRDATVSLPHISREWNERGIEDSGIAAVPFTPAECRHIARALALSNPRPSANGAGPAPGLRIERAPRDDGPFFLVRYVEEDGWPVLRWRGVHRVDGFADTWMIEPVAASANGNGARHDLFHDLSDYLASPVRQHHASFLDEVARVERGAAHRARYVEAYESYRAHLATRIAEERERGRLRYLPLLTALVDELDAHVAELTRQEKPLL